MSNLTNSRAFISFLLVLLQLTFLPNVSRCAGTGLLGGSCCCVSIRVDAHRDTAKPRAANDNPTCCSMHAGARHAADTGLNQAAEHAPLLLGGLSKKGCSCPHAGNQAAWLSEGQGDAANTKSNKKTVAAVLPAAARGNQSCHAISVPARSKPIPQTRTGPPLHLVYQVFLI